MTTRVLIVIGVVAVVAAIVWFAWLGPKLRAGREQQAAVKKIKGFQELETSWSGAVTVVELKGIGDAELRQLAELNPPEMFELRVTKSELSLESFKLFQQFPQLVDLNLRETPVPVEAIEILCEMKQLRRLDLSHTGTEFASVKKLEECIPGISVRY